MVKAIRLCLNTTPDLLLPWIREQEAHPSPDLETRRMETKAPLEEEVLSLCSLPAGEIDNCRPDLGTPGAVPDAVALLQLAAGLKGRRSLAQLREAAAVVGKVIWLDVTPLPSGWTEVLIDFYDLHPSEMEAAFDGMLEQIYGRYPVTENVTDFVLVSTHSMLRSIGSYYPEAAEAVALFLEEEVGLETNQQQPAQSSGSRQAAKVPTRQRDLIRWRSLWRLVQSDIQSGKDYETICNWLETVHPDLHCHPKTLAAIVRAGEAGQLEVAQ